VSKYDWAIVGAGPGGYVAAIRAAQLGQRVAVIEADRPGGVCLNWGCIPSKALLTGAELVETLTRHGQTFGVTAQGLTLDYGALVDHSRKTADRLCKGVTGLLAKNRIEFVAGRGKLAGNGTVEVAGVGRIEADRVMLATGSAEWTPPGIVVDGEKVLTSREALASKRVPGHLVIIGAGAVGMEFAYVYAMYGANVTMIEMADQMLPGCDPDVAAAIAREFRRKKIEVRTKTRFESVKDAGAGVVVSVSSEGGGAEEIAADQVLVAIGRRPLSADLGLETLGIAPDAKGHVPVDARYETTAPGVFAIGDLAGPPLLAHKASEEGIAAVEMAAGIRTKPVDHRTIPFCIYTQPQVAWLGMTEPEARAIHGDDLRVGTFPFTASGKAIATAHTAGFAKVLAEPRHGEIVGAHIVGHGATELIAELGLALTLEATTAELASTTHAHPTLSEALFEAALGAEGRSIHI